MIQYNPSTCYDMIQNLLSNLEILMVFALGHETEKI